MDKDCVLEALAKVVASSSKLITEFCNENNYPHTSFKRDSPTSMLPLTAPEHIRSAQMTLLEATAKIQQLATDGTTFLVQHGIQYNQLNCLQWLCHFKILPHIPLNGSSSYSTIAAAANVPEDHLKSVARMTMTNNFLAEPRPNELAHTSRSALFHENPDLFSWVFFFANTLAPSAAKMVEATERWGSTEVHNQTAFNLAKQTDLPFFDYLATSLELSKEFAGFMKCATSSNIYSLKHVQKGYDWGSLGNSTVVDVGGSNGHASIALAKAFPNLNFIVQDLPKTIRTAKPDIDSLPASVASRVCFQEHDFFAKQPVVDADIYLLRMVIHDWPDGKAILILKNIAAALKKGAKILIVDVVLPIPGTVPVTQDAVLRFRNLTMLQIANGKERGMDEWLKLLADVHEDLEVKSVNQPLGSALSMLEVGLKA